MTSSTISGSAMTGPIRALQPSTRYQITVVPTHAGGTSAPSSAYLAASHAAATLPSSRASVAARGTAPGMPGDTLLVTWAAAAPGDSPSDQFTITITGSDGGGT